MDHVMASTFAAKHGNLFFVKTNFSMDRKGKHTSTISTLHKYTPCTLDDIVRHRK